MPEQSPPPRQRDSIPGKYIPFVVLGLILLLVFDFVVYALIYQKGMIPASLFSAAATQTGTPTAETGMTATVSSGGSSLVATFTPQPPVQSSPAETPIPDLTGIPGSTELPIEPAWPTPPYTTDITPVLDACQYKLKPGKNDFLYSIYWNWDINTKIPVLQNYYAGIICAGLLSNLTCNYQSAHPEITQPGWILVLPGVSPNMCLYHGGTPVPYSGPPLLGT